MNNFSPQAEAEQLRTEVVSARHAEKDAKNKLIEFLNISMMTQSPTGTFYQYIYLFISIYVSLHI